ncbi:MAG: type I-C CRISPR-associated protein Cas7/Csd2 [Fimbriimonadales bacterium]|nr:MAG: type I-C CRISPR-associated protein Cas7/Csd2 [Fimbriimonadales bacterium]
MMTINPNQPYCNPEVRHDFVLLFDVRDGNPNGDPDAGNLPRIDPETMQGIVTDVCLKRKIRNYIDLHYADQYNALDYNEDTEGNLYGIFVRDSGVALNTKIAHAAETQGAAKEKKKANLDIRRELCRRYYDIRMFGAVLSTGDYNAGQVRGPVQLTFARSIDPIVPLDLSITRVAITREGEQKETEMGRKPIVSYALYRAHGFFSAPLAKDTGVSRQDLALLWEAILNMFEHDRSAARGEMALRGLYVFTHASERGNAHAHTLFETIHVQRKDGVEAPRSFADYQVHLRRDALPDSVTRYDLHR